ncbi:MAG: HAD family phosphatase [Alphaproteobacteria bacterium]|nr:HAD family phosphatase [Alphaproteobacteria bacterium]
MKSIFHLTAVPEFVLLDWDNTLVNSDEYYNRVNRKAAFAVCKNMGINGEDFFGLSRGSQFKELFSLKYGPAAVEAFDQECDRVLRSGGVAPPELKRDVLSFLKMLKDRHIPFAVVSNTPQEILEKDVLRALGDSYDELDFLVVGTSKGVTPPKPDAEIVLQSMKLLSQKSGKPIPEHHRVLLVGDNENMDGVAAKKAGINRVIIPENGGVVQGFPTTHSLESLRKTFNKASDLEAYYSQFICRAGWSGEGSSNPEVYTGRYMAESPELSDLPDDLHVTNPKDYALFNDRWLAKFGYDLRGKNHSEEERVAAMERVISSLLTDDLIEKIGESIVARLGVENSVKKPVYFPRQGNRKDDRLYLANYFVEKAKEKVGTYIAQKYPQSNIDILSDKVLFTATKANSDARRTTADVIRRLIFQNIYDVSDFDSGDYVFILDDHVQYGSTLLSRGGSFVEGDVNVIGFAALSGKPSSATLKPSKKLLCMLDDVLFMNAQIHDEKCDYISGRFEDFLSNIGVCRETLTPREVIAYTALLLEPDRTLSCKNGSLVCTSDFFLQLLGEAGYKQVYERKEDNVESIFLQVSLPLTGIEKALAVDLPKAIQLLNPPENKI